MTGQAKLGRSGSSGAFFETNSARRFLANIMPTAVSMSDRAMDLAISGVDVDIGQNIYAAGVPEYNQGQEFFGHYFTNQQLNNGAIKLMGFNPANRTMDRWYINTIRDREKHRQDEASRIAGRIAAAMSADPPQDWTMFLLELDQLEIPYDKNKLSQRLRRASVDMLTREIEDDLKSGLNSGRFNLGVP